MPIIGVTGEVQFRRSVSYSGSFTRTSVDTANNRITGVSGLIATGDKVTLAGAGGIPLDRNADGYADSPGGHAVYSGAGFAQGPQTDHRTSGSSNFYSGTGSSLFYDTAATTGLTTSHDCWIGVNELGYARLYGSFADAVNDTNRLTLFDETTPFTLTATTDSYNILGDVTQFTLNTSRSQLDIAALGEVFGQSVAGSVTGSGSLNCLFSYKGLFRHNAPGVSTQYLYELALRTAQGQDGTARLYIRKSSTSGESIFYETPILITQSALNVQPDAIVAGTIDFVTSGPIALKVE